MPILLAWITRLVLKVDMRTYSTDADEAAVALSLARSLRRPTCQARTVASPPPQPAPP